VTLILGKNSSDNGWWDQTWHKPNARLYRHFDSSRPGHRRDELLERLWSVYLGDTLTVEDWTSHEIAIDHQACIIWRVADVIDPVRDHFANPTIFALVIGTYADAFGGALAGRTQRSRASGGARRRGTFLGLGSCRETSGRGRSSAGASTRSRQRRSDRLRSRWASCWSRPTSRRP
jgi:hypothetical protein